MKRARHSMRFGVAVFVAMLFWPALASAQEVVNCLGGELLEVDHPLQQAIDRLHPDGGFITVTGECKTPFRSEEIDPVTGERARVEPNIFVPFFVRGFTGLLTISGGTLSQTFLPCNADRSTAVPRRDEVLVVEIRFRCG